MRLRPLAIGFLCLAVATALFAAGKPRAQKPVAMGVFTYAVYDANTGRPVVGAEVTSGSQTVVTDAYGLFSLLLPEGRPEAVTVHRSGYVDITFTVVIPLPSQGAPVSGPASPAYEITLPAGTLPPGAVSPPASNNQPTLPPTAAYIPLTGRSPVSVRLTSGATTLLDAETVQFAYVLPFATPEGSNAASFCRADGTASSPDRSDFAQIIGPAKKATSAACCNLGPVLTVDVKMKSGEMATVSFADSCFGYDIVLAGRDRQTAEYVYFKFTDIALVTFP
jgi:hypothetical protein